MIRTVKKNFISNNYFLPLGKYHFSLTIFFDFSGIAVVGVWLGEELRSA